MSSDLSTTILLERARSRIETEFLATGDVLSQAVEGIGTLIAALDTLVEAMDAKTAEATTRDLTSAAAALLTLPAGQARRQAVVRELSAHQTVLVRHVDDMRSSLAYMRAFTINIKIAGGALAGADADFAAFASEIAGGIDLCRSEVEELAADLARLEDKLKSVLSRGQALSVRMDQLLPAVPAELTLNAKTMVDHQQQIAATAAQAAGVARDIRKRIARILGALQIGDITRQRIEHVQAGLAELNRAAAPLSGKAGEHLVALGCTLLNDQLCATLQDFRREMAQIGHSMAELASDARELMRLRDLALGRENGDAGFLCQLEGRIGQASALVGEMVVADNAALAAKGETAEAVQALTARVATIQAIKTDVQCMALNTALRCNRVGEIGKPLSVIAMELRAQGSQLEASAAAGMKVLDQLAAAAASLASEDEGESETQTAGRALKTGAARIRAASEQSETGLADLAARGEVLVNLLDRSSDQVACKGEIQIDLEQATAQLGVAGAGAEVCAEDVDGALVDEALEDFLAVLGAQYTMAQEREVQKAFEQAWSVAPDGAANLEAVAA